MNNQINKFTTIYLNIINEDQNNRPDSSSSSKTSNNLGANIANSFGDLFKSIHHHKKAKLNLNKLINTYIPKVTTKELQDICNKIIDQQQFDSKTKEITQVIVCKYLFNTLLHKFSNKSQIKEYIEDIQDMNPIWNYDEEKPEKNAKNVANKWLQMKKENGNGIIKDIIKNILQKLGYKLVIK